MAFPPLPIVLAVLCGLIVTMVVRYSRKSSLTVPTARQKIETDDLEDGFSVDDSVSDSSSKVEPSLPTKNLNPELISKEEERRSELLAKVRELMEVGEFEQAMSVLDQSEFSVDPSIRSIRAKIHESLRRNAIRPRLKLPPAAVLREAELRQSARPMDWNQRTSLAMQVVVSCILLCSSLFVILSGKYAADQQHWAYGTIGTIVGFWLKSATTKE